MLRRFVLIYRPGRRGSNGFRWPGGNNDDAWGIPLPETPISDRQRQRPCENGGVLTEPPLKSGRSEEWFTPPQVCTFIITFKRHQKHIFLLA